MYKFKSVIYPTDFIVIIKFIDLLQHAPNINNSTIPEKIIPFSF